MNRHGISQNPTAEQSALLRQLWRGDDARHAASMARARTQALIDENGRLLAERDRLLAEIAAALSETSHDPNP